MKTHHLEYIEGGILDMDDLLTELVEDRDKVRMLECWIFFFFLDLVQRGSQTFLLSLISVRQVVI